jgi:hypothetical protein
VEPEGTMSRICYGCRFFSIEQEEPDWSEITPGSPWSMSCTAGFWSFNTLKDDERTFAAKLETAETCPKYEERAK